MERSARHKNQLLILTAGGCVKQHIFEHVSVLLHYTMPLLRTKFWFSLSIFKKDWPWLNRSRRSFKMIDRDQIALGDLLKRLNVSQWIPSIFKNEAVKQGCLPICSWGKFGPTYFLEMRRRIQMRRSMQTATSTANTITTTVISKGKVSPDYSSPFYFFNKLHRPEKLKLPIWH